MSRSSRRPSSRSTKRAKDEPSLGLLQYTIIGLTVATASIHFVVAFDFTFILNGLGYLGLLGALYLPVDLFAQYRRYIRWALIVYTAVTIALWFVITGGAFDLVAYITKAIEVGLIVALWLEEQQRR